MNAILTRPEGYRKKKTNFIFPKVYYRNYPELVYAINNRYIKYNQQLDKVKILEKEKKLFVIRPSRLVNIKRIERNIDKIQEMYDLGIEDAVNTMDMLVNYL